MAPVLFKMRTFTVIGCLLTAHIQLSLPDTQHDSNVNEPIFHLTINSTSTEVGKGENVTLSCFSRIGSLPIKYTLYKGKDRVLHPAYKNEWGEAAEFHFLINFISELGEYKCKAENNITKEKYSPVFNFTMREPLSCPTIISTSTEVVRGENVTLKCSSKTGTLPINYTLYKGKDTVLPPTSKNQKGEEAVFHFTIKLIRDLGEYKCKAENKYTNKYSSAFNFTLREPISNLTINSTSTEVRLGENVTLSCFSRTGSLPIKYTLYKGKDRVQHPAYKNEWGEAAEFHFPINFISELGEYKCKAENNATKEKYSPGFNFTMRAGENNNLAVFIVPPLLLLLLALVLAIPLLILPWYKAGKLRDIPPTDFVPTSYPGSENDVTYAEIVHEKVQEEYVNLEFNHQKEKRRKVSFRDTSTVAYSEVLKR